MITESWSHTFLDQYLHMAPRSRAHFERARRVIPAGATRSLNSWAPHPIYIRGGSGATVWDIDGREYVDFLNNYTGLMLGHAHPRIVEAVSRQLTGGTSFGFSTELEAALAELIVARVPSVERVRFTGSGTEATMFALRLARAFTGRPRIAKMEGGFHGAYDDASVSVRPKPELAGSIGRPASLPESDALSKRLAEEVLILPFNHADETAALVDAHADQLAAIIVEPILGVGGMILPAPGYLALLRDLCTQRGILLIFDEVITLRLGPGGAQERFSVMPDLSVMGKIIGGGMPIGALGGRAEVMTLLEPQGGHDVYDARSGGPRLYQGGTFTGNPLTLAAGIATLSELTPEAYDRLNQLGDQLRDRLTHAFQRHDLAASITGAGSLFAIHMAAGPIKEYRDTWRTSSAQQHEFFLRMACEGFMIAPRGMGCLSTPMTAAHVEQFVEGVTNILLSMRSRPKAVTGTDASTS